MKIDPIKLPREIFLNAPQETQPQFQQLVELLNPWIKKINTLTTQNISFVDNVACMISNLDFTYTQAASNIPLLNSVTEWGAGQKPFTLVKRDGWVELGFLLKHNGTGGTVVIADLPETYRPATVEFGIPGTVDEKPAAFRIDPVTTPGTCPLSLTYVAASPSANKAISLSHRYRAAQSDPVSPGGFFPHFVDVTKLGTKPLAVIPISCKRVVTKRTSLAQTLPNVVWDVTTDGKKESIRLVDLPGLTPGGRYQISLLMLA